MPAANREVHTPSADSSSLEIAERLLAITRLTYAAVPHEPELTRAQWTALHYFCRANANSRTVSAFTRYNATTAGTVSATVASLVRRGLVSRVPLPNDRRTVRIDVTEEGRKVAKLDPTNTLAALVDALSKQESQAVAAVLRTLVTELSRRQRRPVFGMCSTCRHFSTADSQTTPNGSSGRCEEFDLTLSQDNLQELCTRYTPNESVRTAALSAAAL